MINKVLNKFDVSAFDKAITFYSSNSFKMNNKKQVLSCIQRYNKCSFLVSKMDANSEEILREINFEEFGYKSVKDVTIKFNQDLFSDSIKVTMIPKKLYSHRGLVIVPIPINEETKSYQIYLDDLLERVIIQSNNILHITEDEKEIEFYAKKKIQLASIVYSSARDELSRLQDSEDRTLVFNLLSLNLYLIHLLLYLQETFSGFYNGAMYSRKELKAKLCEAIDYRIINQLFKPNSQMNSGEFSFEGEESRDYIKWNCQVNTLITYFYDLAHTTLGNGKPIMESDDDRIVELLTKHFVDKNGKPFNASTVKTILKEYKAEKRAKGNKRLSVPVC